jgi:hypothetical protein
MVNEALIEVMTQRAAESQTTGQFPKYVIELSSELYFQLLTELGMKKLHYVKGDEFFITHDGVKFKICQEWWGEKTSPDLQAVLNRIKTL